MCKTPSERQESELKWNAELEKWQDAEKRKELFSLHGSARDLGPEAAFVMHLISEKAIVMQADFKQVRGRAFSRNCPRDVFYDAIRTMSEAECIHIHEHEGSLIIVLGASSSFVIDDFEEFLNDPRITSDIGQRILHMLEEEGECRILRVVSALEREFSETEVLDHLQQLLDTGRASIIQREEIAGYYVTSGVSDEAVKISAKEAVDQCDRKARLRNSPGDDADELFNLLYENHVGTTIRFTDLANILTNNGYQVRDAIRLLKQLAEVGLVWFERSKFNETEYLVLETGASVENVPIADGLKRVHHHLKAISCGRPVIDPQLIGVRTPSKFIPVPRQRKPDQGPGYCITLQMIEAGIRLSAEESTALELAQLVDRAFKHGKRVSVKLLRRLSSAYHGILPQNLELALATLEAKGVIFRTISTDSAKVIRLTMFGKRVASGEPERRESAMKAVERLESVAG